MDEAAAGITLKPQGHKQRNLWIALALTLTALLCRVPALAAGPEPTLQLHSDSNHYPLAPHVAVLEDPSGELTIEQISSPSRALKFRTHGKSTLDLGVTQSAYWFRFNMGCSGSTTGQISLILDLDQPFLTYASLYTREMTNTGARVWRKIPPRHLTGSLIREPGRYLNFRINMPGPARQVYYLRLKSLAALDLKPQIVTQPGFYESLTKRMLIYGVLGGILLGLAGYHLIIFISLRDVSYLWYVLMVITALAYFLGMNGVIQLQTSFVTSFLNRDLPNVALGLMFAFRILFAKSFLPLKKYLPLADRLLSLLFAISLSLSVLVVMDPSRFFAIRSFLAMGLVVPVLILASGYYCWRSGFAPARFFILAYLFSGSGAMLFVLIVLGRMPFPLSPYHAHQTAMCFEAVLLALALGDRIKNLRRKRKALQQASEMEMRANQRKLRNMMGELINTEERERRQIAGDLHDSVIQDLTGTLWQLRNLRLGNSHATCSRIEKICGSLDKSIKDVRSFIFEISPPELYDFGLGAALDILCARVSKRHSLKVYFNEQGKAPRLSRQLEVGLFRMGRELLINAVKHAGARRITVSCGFKQGALIIAVQDDGVGFSPNPAPANEDSGFGLFSIRERLQTMGGSLRVDSGDGKGSMVTITVPVSSLPGPMEERLVQV